MSSSRLLGLLILIAAVFGVIWFANEWKRPRPGHVLDEALSSGRDAASLPAAGEDYFHDMDGGIALTPDEIKGRDTWIVWTGGNDRFWDAMADASFGSVDLLKTLSSYPTLKANRDNRWDYLGVINEPCFEKATARQLPERHNLWLDRRTKGCPPDPFEDESKYPGVKIGARGKTIEAGSYYGYASGVAGLRLFPNPAFDEKAAKEWDAQRYYTDPSYYNRKGLIRPYRVGMSCGFCHVGPNPRKPPADPNHPRWSNVNSIVGSQYLWVDRIFSWEARPDNFFVQLFRSWRPGTLDTSLVSTDNINNPRSMNAVYLLLPRLVNAKRFAQEKLAGGGLDNRQFNDFVHSGPFTQFFQPPDTVWTPHVLKDGADSVGPLGALNRVYVNIGTFSEEWLLHFNPIVGGKQISPIPIKVSHANSAYYAATEQQTPAVALFLIKASGPDRLKDAPGGSRYLTASSAVLNRGKVVFAENCARCHSSKLPPVQPPEFDHGGCVGPGYLKCFYDYWAWTQTEDFRSKMRRIVLAPDFLDGNYLSNDIRVPVNLLRTNACSPLATNAIADNIWDNYSSQSYKDLPSVGNITWYDPYTGQPHQYAMPAGGRGYTRVPSLIGLWSTAPFLLNNSVGPFDQSPSVDARMRTFNASIEQMLWPERRAHDRLLGAKVPGLMDRTDTRSFLRVAGGYLPDLVARKRGPLERLFPWAFGADPGGGLELGPIPADTPVGLLANIRLLPEDLKGSQRLDYEANVVSVVPSILNDLKQLPHDATDEQARKAFSNLVPRLLKLSKCPDYVVNRGHYFGTGYTEPADSGPSLGPGLSDSDKRALIEFLKNVLNEYDYIVVGSGAGGGTVAARLAEQGASVVVLEAGGDALAPSGDDPVQPTDDRLPFDYEVPAFHAFACENAAMKWDFFVRHYADDEQQRCDPKYRASIDGRNVDGVLYPRAGTLGGCTAHNAMIFVYPHNQDWERIAELTGDETWKPDNMRRYFERLERCEYRPVSRLLSLVGVNPSRHGWHGWLNVELPKLSSGVIFDEELVAPVLAAVAQELGADDDALRKLVAFAEAGLDANDWRLVQQNSIGLRAVPLTTKNQQRVGARERLIDIARRHPDRLTIKLNTLATKVTLDDANRAIGVEFLEGEHLYRAGRTNGTQGRRGELRARREVVLAGGAFNSPQLLMLSGIGPPEHLREHGIDVRVALPGVGSNLQDRYEVAVVNRMNKPWGLYDGAMFSEGDPQFKEWAAKRCGVYTTNGALLTFARRSPVATDAPDLFCMSLLASFNGYYPGFSGDLARRLNYLTWVVLKAHTRNRAGTVRLRSTNPLDTPVINFNYFQEGGDQDLTAMIDGVRFVRRLASPLRDAGLMVEEEPGDSVATDDDLRHFIRSRAWGHHASCTCAIGAPEAGGVLTSDFRVQNVQGLRVVDASVFPNIPGFFIASATYMIAEKAAEEMLRAKTG